MREFRIRSYGRTELAQAYCPELSPDAAYRKLTRWMRQNPRLRDMVSRRMRAFTPAEVRKIVEELGEP